MKQADWSTIKLNHIKLSKDIIKENIPAAYVFGILYAADYMTGRTGTVTISQADLARLVGYSADDRKAVRKAIDWLENNDYVIVGYTEGSKRGVDCFSYNLTIVEWGRDFQFFEVDLRLLVHIKRGAHGALIVYYVCKDHFSNLMHCSNATLAKLTGIKPRTLRDHKNVLSELGWMYSLGLNGMIHKYKAKSVDPETGKVVKAMATTIVRDDPVPSCTLMVEYEDTTRDVFGVHRSVGSRYHKAFLKRHRELEALYGGSENIRRYTRYVIFEMKDWAIRKGMDYVYPNVFLSEKLLNRYMAEHGALKLIRGGRNAEDKEDGASNKVSTK